MKRSEKIAWGFGGALAVLVLAALWIASLLVSDDKGKAAIIGAASALTVAAFTFTGGFLASFRGQMLAIRATVAGERRRAYGQFLAAAERYSDALIARDSAYGQRQTVLSRIQVLAATDPSEQSESDDIDQQLAGADTDLKLWTKMVIEYDESVSNMFAALIDAKAVAELLASEPTSTSIAAYLMALRTAEASVRTARSAFIAAAKKELLIS